MSAAVTGGAKSTTTSLLALAQPPEARPLLALVALVPWVAALRAAAAIEAIWLGALSGTLYGCLVAPWIPEALRALGSSPPTALAGMVLTAAWAKAWVFGVLALLVQRTRSLPPVISALVGAAGLALLEAIVGGVRWGVPWALVGHSQLAAPGVAQLAAVGGVPLLSALVFALSSLVAHRHVSGALALAAAWASLALGGVPVAQALRPEPSGRGPTLGIVQPDIPRGERWGEALQRGNLERVRSFVAREGESALAGVDALALPENLLTDPLDARSDLEEALVRWSTELRLPIVTGTAMKARENDPRLYRSAVVWIAPGAGLVARQDKVQAVPLLESSRPVAGEALLAPLFGDAARWKKVAEAPREQSGALRGPFPVSPVLCYESLFPGLVADRRTPDSVAILNLADDGWVVGEAATRQLTAFASFRAIEQRLPLVRVAHGGLSVVVDENGRRTLALPLDAYALGRVSLEPRPPPLAHERATLLALPLATGGVVWWATSRSRFLRRRRT